MKKYRKKPIVVEAEQWFPEKKIFGVEDAFSLEENEWKKVIYTLEGQMRVSPGDWIIRGINGELYPCKPDVFEKTYDAVDD